MQEITQQLNQLKLTGVRDALEQQRVQANTYAELSFIERLQLLLAHELMQPLRSPESPRAWSIC